MSIRWTVEELLEVIAMLKLPEFKPYDIYDDLHQEIASEVHNSLSTSTSNDLNAGE
jgi:hypothetical protein